VTDTFFLTDTHLMLLILSTALAAVISAIVTFLALHPRAVLLREENARLTAELDAERRAAIEKSVALEQMRENLAGTFSTMASEALKHNSGEFLRLAQENLKQFHIHAQGELAQREKAVETLVQPIREALEKTEKQINEMEKSRAEAYGSLTKHLESMAEAHRTLQGETRNLVQALRRPEVRGQWGEMTLKRLAELAGMVEHCDFFEQEQIRTAEGSLRPDMIVRMPDGRDIIVDAKTPLDAYLSAIEAGDDETRRRELERHARKVRERVRELSAKAYWQQFQNTPDFVVLFIPGEQFLSAALELDRKLLEDAMVDKVILATPTSFIALLRAVGYGWRQMALAENAEQIRKLGEELYGRVANFTEHLARLGKSLESSVSHFNKTVGTFDTRVLPSVRRFSEMGISAKKELTDVAQIEVAARDVTTADEDKS
jgi:DNA recombination protein RmuC